MTLDEVSEEDCTLDDKELLESGTELLTLVATTTLAEADAITSDEELSLAAPSNCGEPPPPQAERASTPMPTGKKRITCFHIPNLSSITDISATVY
jgi:hypothetical protein